MEKNLNKAFQYYKFAAEKGHPHSQLQLAKFYLEAKGTEKNVKEAKKWLKLAIYKGNEEALKIWQENNFEALTLESKK